MDMTSVINLIINMIKQVYNTFSLLSFDINGFAFNIIDFFLMLLVLSFVLPLFVVPLSGGFSSHFASQSERNDVKEYREKQMAYYEERSRHYKIKNDYYTNVKKKRNRNRR